jgi:hypothetical protein
VTTKLFPFPHWLLKPTTSNVTMVTSTGISEIVEESIASVIAFPSSASVVDSIVIAKAQTLK